MPSDWNVILSVPVCSTAEMLMLFAPVLGVILKKTAKFPPLLLSLLREIVLTIVVLCISLAVPA